MALQIIEFRDIAEPVFNKAPQLPHGLPIRVTNATGSYTVGESCRLICIKGSGSITWPGIATAESFDGPEFRRVQPGDQFTVA